MNDQSNLQKPGKTDLNRQFVMRALTDPEFRAMLETSPKKALGFSRLTAKKANEISMVLKTVKSIEQQIFSMADELLCATGGPCGIG